MYQIAVLGDGQCAAISDPQGRVITIYRLQPDASGALPTQTRTITLEPTDAAKYIYAMDFPTPTKQTQTFERGFFIVTTTGKLLFIGEGDYGWLGFIKAARFDPNPNPQITEIMPRTGTPIRIDKMAICDKNIVLLTVEGKLWLNIFSVMNLKDQGKKNWLGKLDDTKLRQLRIKEFFLLGTQTNIAFLAIGITFIAILNFKDVVYENSNADCYNWKELTSGTNINLLTTNNQLLIEQGNHFDLGISAVYGQKHYFFSRSESTLAISDYDESDTRFLTPKNTRKQAINFQDNADPLEMTFLEWPGPGSTQIYVLFLVEKWDSITGDRCRDLVIYQQPQETLHLHSIKTITLSFPSHQSQRLNLAKHQLALSKCGQFALVVGRHQIYYTINSEQTVGKIDISSVMPSLGYGAIRYGVKVYRTAAALFILVNGKLFAIGDLTQFEINNVMGQQLKQCVTLMHIDCPSGSDIIAVGVHEGAMMFCGQLPTGSVIFYGNGPLLKRLGSSHRGYKERGGFYLIEQYQRTPSKGHFTDPDIMLFEHSIRILYRDGYLCVMYLRGPRSSVTLSPIKPKENIKVGHIASTTGDCGFLLSSYGNLTRCQPIIPIKVGDLEDLNPISNLLFAAASMAMDHALLPVFITTNHDLVHCSTGQTETYNISQGHGKFLSYVYWQFKDEIPPIYFNIANNESGEIALSYRKGDKLFVRLISGRDSNLTIKQYEIFGSPPYFNEDASVQASSRDSGQHCGNYGEAIQRAMKAKLDCVDTVESLPPKRTPDIGNNDL